MYGLYGDYLPPEPDGYSGLSSILGEDPYGLDPYSAARRQAAAAPPKMFSIKQPAGAPVANIPPAVAASIASSSRAVAPNDGTTGPQEGKRGGVLDVISQMLGRGSEFQQSQVPDSVRQAGVGRALLALGAGIYGGRGANGAPDLMAGITQGVAGAQGVYDQGVGNYLQMQGLQQQAEQQRADRLLQQQQIQAQTAHTNWEVEHGRHAEAQAASDAADTEAQRKAAVESMKMALTHMGLDPSLADADPVTARQVIAENMKPRKPEKPEIRAAADGRLVIPDPKDPTKSILLAGYNPPRPRDVQGAGGVDDPYARDTKTGSVIQRLDPKTGQYSIVAFDPNEGRRQITDVLLARMKEDRRYKDLPLEDQIKAADRMADSLIATRRPRLPGQPVSGSADAGGAGALDVTGSVQAVPQRRTTTSAPIGTPGAQSGPVGGINVPKGTGIPTGRGGAQVGATHTPSHAPSDPNEAAAAVKLVSDYGGEKGARAALAAAGKTPSDVARILALARMAQGAQ